MFSAIVIEKKKLIRRVFSKDVYKLTQREMLFGFIQT